VRIIKYRSEEKRKKKLAVPILISILLHIIILILLLHKDILGENKKTAELEKKKNYIEISELPVPKEKETKPPEKPRVLAERSHKAEEEKTIDRSTRLTRPSTPASKPSAKAPPPQNKEEEKKQAKTEPENKEKPQKKQEKTAKKESAKEKKPVESIKQKPEETKKQELAASKKDNVEKESSTSKQTQQKETREKKSKNLSDIGEQLLASRPSKPAPPNVPSSEKEQQFGANVPKKEDTVDLSTREFKYISYFTNLKRKIDGVWNYPRESQLRGQTGQLYLTFTLNRDGSLADIKLTSSSGYQLLDDEAIRAIKVASPFNPFPDSWKLEKLNIRASFEYRFSKFLR